MRQDSYIPYLIHKKIQYYEDLSNYHRHLALNEEYIQWSYIRQGLEDLLNYVENTNWRVRGEWDYVELVREFIHQMDQYSCDSVSHEVSYMYATFRDAAEGVLEDIE